MKTEKTWEGHRRTKYVRKRDIKPKEWYMLDLSNPLSPVVPSKHLPKRSDILKIINREFGLNPLVFPVMGADLIKHGQLLNCTTTRRWGKVFLKYEYPPGLDTPGRKAWYQALHRKIKNRE